MGVSLDTVNVFDLKQSLVSDKGNWTWPMCDIQVSYSDVYGV